jgi:polysaccharide pyruvyl transferase WcaK-like protein/glycosyltransferase involved in cell wall biosynthesis
MHVPRVSFGMPVYNGEDYIRLAVESILQQDYTDFELIISDNASTDATQEICEELAAKDARIRYSRNVTNIGASKNYKRVFELSRGEFFSWAAHDDVHLPKFLRRCVDVLDQAPAKVVLVAPRTEVIDENGVKTEMCVERLHTTRGLPHRRLADVLRNVEWATAQFGLFRSAALRKTRLIDAFYASDYVLLLEVAILGEIWEIPETLFLRRFHAGISTKTNKTKAEFAAWFDPMQKGRNPRSKLMVEYVRSIARLRLAPVERLLCLWTAFFVWYRRKLTESARFSARNLVRLSKRLLKRLLQGTKPEERDSKQRKVCFYGAFGWPNFGNEITLQTILHHLRRRAPESKVGCVCIGPDVLQATENIDALPISPTFVKHRRLRTRWARLLERIFIEVLSEPWRWLDAFKRLKGTDTLIVPGTGVLTDAFGLLGWGPYNLFKWSLIAKLRGCEVLFVSVGAGPIDSALGRYFVKSALSVANFRSYRDDASMAYLKGIGFRTNGDCVYPDLVFSLPETIISHDGGKRAGRPVVGLGLMTIHGMYGCEKPSSGRYQEYLDNLVALSGWLLAHEYVIRLLVGEIADSDVLKQFKSQLKASFGSYDEDRILDQPTLCVEQLLPQIADTEMVVATRFHNVLLALVFNKPVIAISFNHKSASLMRYMGLTEYCQDINDMKAGSLIEQFRRLEANAEKLKPVIRQKVEESRKALEEQYKLIFKCKDAVEFSQHKGERRDFAACAD